MDPRERFNEISVAMRAMLEGFQPSLWTAMPGIVQSFDPATESCVVQPAISARVQDKLGNYSWVQLPLLSNVPAIFPGGGGFTLTFPIAEGDEGLMIFSRACIDGWWQSGGVQVQPELRLHDISDGFILVGPRSKPRALSWISTASAQLRSDDGEVYVEVAGGHVVNVVASTVNVIAPNVNLVASAEVKMTTPLAHVTGALEVEGDITVNKGHLNEFGMTFFSTQYNTHTHADPQGGNTGPPSNLIP